MQPRTCYRETIIPAHAGKDGETPVTITVEEHIGLYLCIYQSADLWQLTRASPNRDATIRHAVTTAQVLTRDGWNESQCDAYMEAYGMAVTLA